MNRTIPCESRGKVSIKVVRATFTVSLSGIGYILQPTTEREHSSPLMWRMLDKFARETRDGLRLVCIQTRSQPYTSSRVQAELSRGPRATESRRDVRAPTEFRRVRRSHQHSLEPEERSCRSRAHRADTGVLHRRSSQA